MNIIDSQILPIVFEYAYSQFNQKDVKSFFTTSKKVYQITLKAERLFQSVSVDLFLKFVFTETGVTPPEKLKEFNVCRNLFDVRASKLKKQHNVFHYLQTLDDKAIEKLRIAIMREYQPDIYSGMIKSLKTNSEIEGELEEALKYLKDNKFYNPLGSYKEIIDSLLVRGLFEKASMLLEMQNLEPLSEDFVAEYHNFAFINAPFFNSHERKIIFRDVFESFLQDFRVAPIKNKIKIWTTKFYDDSLRNEINNFMKLWRDEFSDNCAKAQSQILEAVIYNSNLPNSDVLEAEVIKNQINENQDTNTIPIARANLAKNDFETALHDANRIFNERKKNRLLKDIHDKIIEILLRSKFERSDLPRVLNLFNFLPNERNDRRLALLQIVNQLFPGKNWMLEVNEAHDIKDANKRRAYLDDFFEILELSVDIDKLNLHPDENMRNKLFDQVFSTEDVDTVMLLKSMECPNERREFIRDVFNK